MFLGVRYRGIALKVLCSFGRSASVYFFLFDEMVTHKIWQFSNILLFGISLNRFQKEGNLKIWKLIKHLNISPTLHCVTFFPRAFIFVGFSYFIAS